MKKKGRQKGSLTIEGSFWIAFILFLFMTVLELGISFFQDSKDREELSYLESLDIVSEFYTYQVIHEVVEEVTDD